MSATKTFLLELHCEEIPARFLEPLITDFGEKLRNLFLEHHYSMGLVWKDINVTDQSTTKHIDVPVADDPSSLRNHLGEFAYSPRKLSWRVTGVPDSSPSQVRSEIGPPERLCKDESGNPTIQGQKFAEKWGVGFDRIQFKDVGKKERCAVVTFEVAGRPTLDLLAEALPGLIAGLHVPKAMRWGSSDFEFVRPIRNILCLFGEEVVPITVDGVRATNSTWGHRLYHRQHPEPVKVGSPEAYEAALEAAGVVVSVDVRRARIAAQLEALATEAGGRVVADAELLDTLAEIVEFPKIVRGDFPASFLELPKEVLVTSLREHQKSFCIEGADGRLLPCFLTAANRTDDPAGFVKAGNEWVLKARLYEMELQKKQEKIR